MLLRRLVGIFAKKIVVLWKLLVVQLLVVHSVEL